MVEDILTFFAEIKQTKQTKSASLDNVYTITLATDNPELLELGKLPPLTLVKVSVEVASSEALQKDNSEIESAAD